MVLQHGGSL